MQSPAHTRKVAAILLEKALSEGRSTPRGVAVQLDVSKQDVASIFSLSRIDATLAINTLKQAGALVWEGSTLLVDMEVLKRFASGEATTSQA